jgi:hypothetical protein
VKKAISPLFKVSIDRKLPVERSFRMVSGGSSANTNRPLYSFCNEPLLSGNMLFSGLVKFCADKRRENFFDQSL